jgi:hypothetical protein
LPYEWDPAKAASNLRKHRVSFREAKAVFDDWRVRHDPDEDHSACEDRNRAIGRSDRGRLLTVIYTLRGERTRIISARLASPRERRAYERRL